MKKKSKSSLNNYIFSFDDHIVLKKRGVGVPETIKRICQEFLLWLHQFDSKIFDLAYLLPDNENYYIFIAHPYEYLHMKEDDLWQKFYRPGLFIEIKSYIKRLRLGKSPEPLLYTESYQKLTQKGYEVKFASSPKECQHALLTYLDRIEKD
jgi:hypothetical protein